MGHSEKRCANGAGHGTRLNPVVVLISLLFQVKCLLHILVCKHKVLGGKVVFFQYLFDGSLASNDTNFLTDMETTFRYTTNFPYNLCEQKVMDRSIKQFLHSVRY